MRSPQGPRCVRPRRNARACRVPCSDLVGFGWGRSAVTPNRRQDLPQIGGIVHGDGAPASGAAGEVVGEGEGAAVGDGVAVGKAVGDGDGVAVGAAVGLLVVVGAGAVIDEPVPAPSPWACGRTVGQWTTGGGVASRPGAPRVVPVAGAGGAVSVGGGAARGAGGAVNLSVGVGALAGVPVAEAPRSRSSEVRVVVPTGPGSEVTPPALERTLPRSGISTPATGGRSAA
jgi:hypothetical protein